MNKICKKCKEVKDEVFFNFYNKALNKRKSKCKQCENKYNKDRYEDTKEYHINKAEKWTAENRAKYLQNQQNYNKIRKSKNIIEK